MAAVLNQIAERRRRRRLLSAVKKTSRRRCCCSKTLPTDGSFQNSNYFTCRFIYTSSSLTLLRFGGLLLLLRASIILGTSSLLSIFCENIGRFVFVPSNQTSFVESAGEALLLRPLFTDFHFRERRSENSSRTTRISDAISRKRNFPTSITLVVVVQVFPLSWSSNWRRRQRHQMHLGRPRESS